MKKETKEEIEERAAEAAADGSGRGAGAPAYVPPRVRTLALPATQSSPPCGPSSCPPQYLACGPLLPPG